MLSLSLFLSSPFSHPPPLLFPVLFVPAFCSFLFLSCPIIVWTILFINPTRLTLFSFFPTPFFVLCCLVFLPLEVPVSSVLCLSSVRELPVQVRDLYAQGFVLVAVHPFVHPCGPRNAHIQRQLHRAVLVRETHRYQTHLSVQRQLQLNLRSFFELYISPL